MNEWIKEIAIEDLPESYQEMACIVGIEATLKLAEHYSKQGFYFRSLEELIAEKKKQYIIENFTGVNHAELARATGYSERWIYEILNKSRDDKQAGLLL